jgi:hypothetical protein
MSNMKYLFGTGFMDDCMQFFALQSPMNPSQIGIIKLHESNKTQNPCASVDTGIACPNAIKIDRVHCTLPSRFIKIS